MASCTISHAKRLVSRERFFRARAGMNRVSHKPNKDGNCTEIKLDHYQYGCKWLTNEVFGRKLCRYLQILPIHIYLAPGPCSPPRCMQVRIGKRPGTRPGGVREEAGWTTS